MEEGQLSSLQKDALREVSNIGTGNAATALSMLLNQKIDMTVPSINLIELSMLFDQVGEDEVAGIVVRVLGDICQG